MFIILKVIYLESFCDNPEIIETNIRSVKISSPDYIGWNPEKAVQDFKSRIDVHLPYYETLDEKFDTQYSYVKLINLDQMIINNVKGYLQVKK